MAFCVELLLLALLATNTFSTLLLYNDHELSKLGASCKNLDSCLYKHFETSKGIFDCSCSSDCYKYGTCCASALLVHKQPSYKSSCVSTCKDQAYYMVDTCSSTKHTTDQEWDKLCEDDHLILDYRSTAPITSTETQLTYKNLFCFKCNEGASAFVPWTISISGDVQSVQGGTPTLHKGSKTWFIKAANNETTPVSLSYRPPAGVVAWIKACFPYTISACFGKGHAADSQRKCEMYLSYVSVTRPEGRRIYKNPHCAACNGENLKHMQCGIL